ncbi:hypothetical protein LOK49_LG15G00964 [Camellia lanceoleosa]|uniref:Uncharacterized protein n=1 Tax=Camellia lanceoleosa TaxID=1840588 RepID=A0ACC0F601_9ERIC|nr:hypothetical protein LOK49_LG15G00964 [Camellia lanceoleosa]
MHTSTAENLLSLSESHHRKPSVFVRIAPPKALFSVRFASLMRQHRKRSSPSISQQIRDLIWMCLVIWRADGRIWTCLIRP